MTSQTPNFGLTKLDPGESIHAGSGRFPSDDRDTIDSILYALATRRFTGSASTAPTVAPDLTLSTTGGTIPASTTVRYKYTYVDPETGESTASPEASVTTQAPLSAPVAPTHTLQSIGGTLEPGQYFYVLTQYVGSSTVETKALNPLAVTIPAGTSTNEVTLTLPALDPSATGFNVYRRAPGESQYYFLESTGGSSYVDGGVAATTRGLPSANTTFATNKITVDIPGATPSIPAGNQWKLYRSYSADYGNSFLSQQAEAVLSVEDVGNSTIAGSPPFASIAAPTQIDLTTEVQGELPVANGGTGAATAAGARTNLGLGTIATQAASGVAITGGSITGITDLAVADGGTGASTAANARTNLGLGTMATQAASSVAITGGSVTGITDLAVADGGTGASTAANARTNLGAAAATDLTNHTGASSGAHAASAISIADAGGLITATEVEGALQELASATSTVVRKAADETISNSTTFQSDDELTVAIGANETLVGQFHIFHVSDPTADIKFTIARPAGATLLANSIGGRTGDNVGQVGAANDGGLMGHGSTTAGMHTVISFSVTNGATAGSVTLQWAQLAAVVANCTVKAGSFLLAHRNA